MENNNIYQTHSGSGDIVGRDKIIQVYLNSNSNNFIKSILSGKDKYLTEIPAFLCTNFIGRQTEMEILYSHLNQDKVISLFGIGGIGKSAFLQNFVKEYASRYRKLAFVEVKGDFITSFVSTTNWNDKEVFIENEGTNIEKFYRLLSQLDEYNGDNLLIIDNPDKSISNYKSNILNLKNWKIVIATRQPIEELRPFKLEELEIRQAKALFYNLFQGVENDTLLPLLLAKLSTHTLTLRLIAKTARKNHWKIEDVYDKVNKYGIEIDKYTKIIDPSTEKELSTFEHLLDRFFFDDLNSDCRWVLQQFSVIPSTAYSKDFLRLIFSIPDTFEEDKGYVSSHKDFILNTMRGVLDMIDEKHGLKSTEQSFGIKNRVRYEDAIQLLIDRGWLYDEPEGIICHEVLKNVVQRRLPPNSDICHELISNLSELIDFKEINVSEVSTKSIFAELSDYLSNALLLVNEGNERQIADLGLANLLFLLSIYYKVEGNYEKALTKMQFVIECREDFYEHLKSDIEFEDDRRTFSKAMIKTYSVYASCLHELKNNKDAIKYYKIAIEMLKELNTDTYLLANSYNSIAVVYISNKEFSVALDYQLKGLDVFLSILPSNHPNIGSMYSNISVTYDNLNNKPKEVEYLMKALDIESTTLDKNHSNFIATYNNLAISFYEQKQYKTAFEYINKSVEIAKLYYTDNHPKMKQIIKTQKEIEGSMNTPWFLRIFK